MGVAGGVSSEGRGWGLRVGARPARGTACRMCVVGSPGGQAGERAGKRAGSQAMSSSLCPSEKLDEFQPKLNKDTFRQSPTDSDGFNHIDANSNENLTNSNVCRTSDKFLMNSEKTLTVLRTVCQLLAKSDVRQT